MLRTSLLTFTAWLALGAMAFADTASTAGAVSGNAGLWAWLAPWLTQASVLIVGGVLTVLTWIVKEVAREAIPAVMENRIRETMLTMASVGIADAEGSIDAWLTPDRKAKIIARMVGYVLKRMPGPIAKLGLTQDVLANIASKMLAQAVAAAGAATPSTVIGPVVVPPIPAQPVPTPNP